MKDLWDVDELTPEYVRKAGRELIDAVFDATPVEQAMQRYSPEERLDGLAPEQAMRHYSSEERLAGMAPAERLAGLDEEQIREYLEQLQKRKRK